MRQVLRCAALLSFLLVHSVADAAPSRWARSEAEKLVRKAERHLATGTIDHRRIALQELEQATRYDPANPAYELALARAYYQVGYLGRARQRFTKVTKLAPTDAEGRYGLGQVWRRDWMKYLEQRSLDLAIEHLSAACRLRTDHADSWLLLVPLLVERGDLRAAASAADRARESAPERPEPVLAHAYTAYRLGQVEEADRSFRSAMPRLHPTVREKFFDIAPVTTEQDTVILNALSLPKQEEYKRRFWRENDPDLATEVNEAQLEYWARVAHAYFLFFNSRRREWDERGEVYVRYGSPVRMDYNPVGTFNYSHGFPANALVWYYPDLGMRVVMHDRTLNEFYTFPATMRASSDPEPFADSLARHGEALAIRGGRGVFPKLPPGVDSLPVRGTIARFASGRGGRLLAQIEATGSPADSLYAEWVVLDSTRHEVSRGGRNLTASACDATERRVADFAAELPPGPYLVGLSVRDRDQRRGVYRSEVVIRPPHEELEVSDLVVSCGTGGVGAGPAVRIDPNPSARVTDGEPLTAYFEIYHLRPDGDGQSRFEYEYTVKSAEKDPRLWIQRTFAPRKEPPPINVSREVEQEGELRRQFVTVPVQTLPRGRYWLEVAVKDLVAGTEVVTRAQFEKVGGLRN